MGSLLSLKKKPWVKGLIVTAVFVHRTCITTVLGSSSHGHDSESCASTAAADCTRPSGDDVLKCVLAYACVFVCTYGPMSVTIQHLIAEATDHSSLPWRHWTNSKEAKGESMAGADETRDVLELGHIRSTLIRQEDTILFHLIERAQFKYVFSRAFVICVPAMMIV